MSARLWVGTIDREEHCQHVAITLTLSLTQNGLIMSPCLLMGRYGRRTNQQRLPLYGPRANQQRLPFYGPRTNQQRLPLLHLKPS